MYVKKICIYVLKMKWNLQFPKKWNEYNLHVLFPLQYLSNIHLSRIFIWFMAVTLRSVISMSVNCHLFSHQLWLWRKKQERKAEYSAQWAISPSSAESAGNCSANCIKQGHMRNYKKIAASLASTVLQQEWPRDLKGIRVFHKFPNE